MRRSRRVLLASLAGTLGALALEPGGDGPNARTNPTVRRTPPRFRGRPQRPGSALAFERPRRIAVGSGQGSSLAPLQDLVGIITPRTCTSSATMPACLPSIRNATNCSSTGWSSVTGVRPRRPERFPACPRLHFSSAPGTGPSYRASARTCRRSSSMASPAPASGAGYASRCCFAKSASSPAPSGSSPKGRTRR